jgi:predicted nucleic acid-binding protein
MVTCLLDTNVLLYLANPAAPQHNAASRAVVRILADGGRLTVAAQVLFEFWSVATRPVSANGLGWTVAQTRLAIDGFRTRFFVLEETPAVVDLWLDLVVSNELKGKRIHDAHLLATMQANGVTHLLTFNVADFPPGAGLTILLPSAIA